MFLGTSAPQLFSRLETIAVEKVAGGGTFLAFQLDLEQLQGSICAATHEEAIAARVDFGCRQGFSGGQSFPYLQILAAKFCVDAGPGLEAANAVENFGGAAGEVDQAIFFF